MTLTVDAETCKVAYDALNSYGKKGACVIYNYKTGEVICSVSTNSYDPQNPPTISEENESEYDGVYLDNVLSSSYTPGSIFKIVTMAAAIENIPDLYERTWTCTGSQEIGGSDITCVETHGTIDINQAMAHSCNIVFAELAVEIGADKMTETAEKIGINMSFEVDDVKTAEGNYDVSKANTNQLAWSGVGQYNDKVNPMQMVMICGAIANGGKTTEPTLIKDGASSILQTIGINSGSNGREMFSENTAAKLDETMRYTITDYYGDYLFGGLSVCAKTGTGEVGDDKEPNAWMVGYSKDEDCPLAFACVVEDAGFGFSYAGPVVEASMIQAAKSLGASAVTG
ncbi:MAG: penicillin-binding transpeptidase domain-containing protein, partial [Ruminococcus sp.]|nr:penicillin-binding transpeptidase domain-containing protein [Ruminococcus sp.]